MEIFWLLGVQGAKKGKEPLFVNIVCLLWMQYFRETFTQMRSERSKKSSMKAPFIWCTYSKEIMFIYQFDRY